MSPTATPFLGAAFLGVPGTSTGMEGMARKIVVGLGNPGQRYADTRHNIGWMVLDRLADRAGISGRARARDAAATASARYDDLDLLLVKPTTFMNESGIAVRKILARERAPLEEMLVVIDDFALPFGRLRFRERGSAGSHNGLRSIIDELSTEDFARLRVGIGEPGEGQARDHVLSRFSPEERKRLDILLEAAADGVEEWGRSGTPRAADRWNPWTPPWTDDAQADPAEQEPPAIPEPDLRRPGDDPAIRRTSTGWRRLLRPGAGESR
jgi:peptidyl-tRNA hydrolase, PTH1 family